MWQFENLKIVFKKASDKNQAFSNFQIIEFSN